MFQSDTGLHSASTWYPPTCQNPAVSSLLASKAPIQPECLVKPQPNSTQVMQGTP